MAPKKNLVSRKKVYRKKGKRTMKKRNMTKKEMGGGGAATGAAIALTGLYHLVTWGTKKLKKKLSMTKTAEKRYNIAQNNDLQELLKKINEIQKGNISPKDNKKLNSIKQFIEKLKAKIPEPEGDATEGPIIKVRKWKRFVVPILEQFIGDKSKYNFQYENQLLEENMTPLQIEAEEREALKLQQEATAEIEAEKREEAASEAMPGVEGAAPGDMPGKVAAFCLCFEGSNPDTVLEALKKEDINPTTVNKPFGFSNPIYGTPSTEKEKERVYELPVAQNSPPRINPSSGVQPPPPPPRGPPPSPPRGPLRSPSLTTLEGIRENEAARQKAEADEVAKREAEEVAKKKAEEAAKREAAKARGEGPVTSQLRGNQFSPVPVEDRTPEQQKKAEQLAKGLGKKSRKNKRKNSKNSKRKSKKNNRK